MVDNHRPILVTGGHRSGTGWVGKMLAATRSPRIGYIWEPFNLRCRPGVCGARFPYWFYLVDEVNGARYREALEDTLAFRYDVSAEIMAIRSPKDAARWIRDQLRARALRASAARPLMKDPIALFSAPWLADTFDMEVIVLIRHPAAFVNSLVSKGWRHPFDHFVRQPRLMESLAPFQEQIERFSVEEQPLTDQAILLWNVLHQRIASYTRSHPGWTFSRHEDVSREPIAWFRSQYERLGLEWSAGVRATIEEHTSSGNPTTSADPASHRRDSQASVSAWKSRLDTEAIDRIRAATETIASEFYSDEDW